RRAVRGRSQCGADRARDFAEQLQREIDQVDARLVEATTSELTAPPALAGRVVVDRLPYLDHNRALAVRACPRDHVAKHGHRTELVIDRYPSSGRARAREQFATFANTRREWLLAQHLRACVDRGDAVRRVECRGTGDDDQLRSGVGKELDQVTK